MKMTNTDYIRILHAVREVVARPLTVKYVGDHYEALGLSRERLRWDLLRATGWVENGLMKELYKYLNDTHIDTALARVMDELQYRLYKETK